MGSVFRQKTTRKDGRVVVRRNWMMKYYRNGRAIIESSGTPLKMKAQRICNDRETDSGRGLPVGAAVGKIRFDAAAADLEADYSTNGRRSLAAVQRRIALHLGVAFGGWKLADLSTADIRAYTARRLAAGAAVGTVNRELTILKRMFTLAVQGGKLLHRPHIPLLQESNVRAGFFEREAFESVRAHLPDALQPVVTFAYITGWRIDSEILPLEWRQVDLESNEVRLDPGTTKNDDGRVFHLTSELRAVLLARQQVRDQLAARGLICPRVFVRLVAKGRGGTKYPKPIKRFNKAWTTACRLAGQPGKIPHDFRRTAVRNMVRRGVPERVAMQMTGHKTRSVFERYNIVSPGDLADAALKLDGLGAGSTTGSTDAAPQLRLPWT
jgi:integrase